MARIAKDRTFGLPQDNYYTGKPDKPYRGFTTCEGTESIHEFNVSCEIQETVLETNEFNPEIVPEKVKELTEDIAKQLLEMKLPRVEFTKEPINNNLKVNVKLIAAPPGTKMVSVENDCFILEEENFDEDEIAQALKIAYPERFI